MGHHPLQINKIKICTKRETNNCLQLDPLLNIDYFSINTELRLIFHNVIYIQEHLNERKLSKLLSK